MKKVRIEKPIKECLREAFKNKAVITSDALEPTEFIYVRGRRAYYEDGGCLGSFCEAHEYLSSQRWANNKWFIIGYMSEDEIQAIKELENLNRTLNKAWDGDWLKKEIMNILNMEEN